MNYVNDPEKFKEASRNPYKAKTCDFRRPSKETIVYLYLLLYSTSTKGLFLQPVS